MEWTAVGKISTGITLLAFIAALIAAAYRASIKGRINALKALRPEDRLAAVTQTLNTFGISSANLSQDNAYHIALRELSIKDRKYKLIAIMVVVLALIFAIVAVYVIYDIRQKRADSSGVSSDALAAVVAASTRDWRSLVENDQQTIRALERQHNLTEVQLHALLTQIGHDPGTATGDELNDKLVVLVRELQEGKAVLQKVDATTVGTTDPQVKALQAQAREAIEQGNLSVLRKSLEALSTPYPGARTVGCYADRGELYGTAGRDLNGAATEQSDMTREKCVSHCASRGFSYAGMQYGDWCFCGQTYGKFGVSDVCNMPCAGNQHEICGGYWANSIFDIGESAPEPRTSGVK